MKLPKINVSSKIKAVVRGYVFKPILYQVKSSSNAPKELWYELANQSATIKAELRTLCTEHHKMDWFWQGENAINRDKSSE